MYNWITLFAALKYLFLKVFEGILIVRSYVFASVIFDVAWFYFFLGYVGNRKFSVTASPESIRRAEELARGVPKALAFNLLNLLVDLKTQSESNISGQNGKRLWMVIS